VVNRIHIAYAMWIFLIEKWEKTNR